MSNSMSESKNGTACWNYVGGRCTLGLVGGNPTQEDCDGCSKYDGPSRGLGDDVHRITSTTGIEKVAEYISNLTGKDCGCGKRRKKLNQAFPSRDHDNGSDIHGN